MTDSTTKKAIKKLNIIGIMQQIFGWYLTIPFGLATIGGIIVYMNFNFDSFEIAITITFAIITACGISLIRIGYGKIKLIKIFKNYSSRLATNDTLSIDLLASSTGKTTQEVANNLIKMINKGLFPNSYIDTQRNCLVTSNIQSPINMESVTNDYTIEIPVVAISVIECSNCGATNRVDSHFISECEFCGSQISVEV